MLDHQFVRGQPLFASLPDQEIDYLARKLELVEVPQDTELIYEGRTTDQFFILLEGVVDIIKATGTPDERLLASRGPGTLLGEMSIFSQDHLATATVRTICPSRLLEMKRSDFESLLIRQPGLAYHMVRTMTSRFVESENATIAELREINRQLTLAYQDLKAAQERLVEQEKLEHELEIAHQIQHSILPEALPVIAGYDFGALFTPARAVGGDFYDFIPLSGERLGIVIGDVSDKGIPAALFMSLVYSQMRSEARRHRTPGAVLGAVNRSLMEFNVARMYVTLIYGVFDCPTGEFSFARAGHPLPIVLDQNCQPLTLQDAVGQPLSMLVKPQFDQQTITLPPGGALLLFTDGVTEASDLQDNLYESEGFLDDLRQFIDRPAQEVCEYLYERVVEHSGAGPQQDDVTLLCIKH
jgi:phosphoserine phosphatase RsbU/P